MGENDMKRILLLALAVVVANFLAILLHVELYQSRIPQLSWGSMLIHLAILIVLPYKSIFKLKIKQDK